MYLILNFSEKRRERDFDRHVNIITFLEETLRNFTRRHRGISCKRSRLPD